MTSALSSRETAKIDLLCSIVNANTHNEHPSKADLSRGLPNKTRAARYAQIDQLIRRGLVTNEGTGNTYALAATPAGVAEAARWMVR